MSKYGRAPQVIEIKAARAAARAHAALAELLK
jgi:hypothetical protein